MVSRGCGRRVVVVVEDDFLVDGDRRCRHVLLRTPGHVIAGVVERPEVEHFGIHASAVCVSAPNPSLQKFSNSFIHENYKKHQTELYPPF